MKIFKLTLVFLLLLLLVKGFVLSTTVVPLTDFFNPDSITVDDRHVYITEFPTIYIFSLQDFKLKKKLGRQGEGPREFNRFALLSIHDDNLVVSDRNKVLYYTKDGDYLKEIKARSIMHWGVRPIGNLFVGKSKIHENKIDFDTANIYDANLEKIKKIFMTKFFFQIEGGGKKCDAIEIRGLQFQVFNDKVFFKRGKHFIIDVFDRSGNFLYTIHHEFEKIKISEADKKRYHDYFKRVHPWKRMYESLIKKEIYFPEFFPAIQLFIVADDKIYVLTYKKENEKSEFVVLDLKGGLLKKVFLPFNQSDEWFHYSLTKATSQASTHVTFTIKNGKLYQLIENEDKETWELHITNIEEEGGG
ncbi:MAG: hypothetical protein PVH61_19645 [Candidatus Aminicenantes bacterium]|jgi:hypothetical protein